MGQTGVEQFVVIEDWKTAVQRRARPVVRRMELDEDGLALLIEA